jgi:hypothetical protein
MRHEGLDHEGVDGAHAAVHVHHLAQSMAAGLL